MLHKGSDHYSLGFVGIIKHREDSDFFFFFNNLSIYSDVSPPCDFTILFVAYLKIQERILRFQVSSERLPLIKENAFQLNNLRNIVRFSLLHFSSVLLGRLSYY